MSKSIWAVLPPPPARNLGKFQKMRFMATFFAEMLSIFSKSDFDHGNGYFDNDNGPTLLLDGSVMGIMVDNGEI